VVQEPPPTKQTGCGGAAGAPSVDGTGCVVAG
jgi:hypothetical protein